MIHHTWTKEQPSMFASPTHTRKNVVSDDLAENNMANWQERQNLNSVMETEIFYKMHSCNIIDIKLLASFSYIDIIGNRFFSLTDAKISNFRLI